MKKSHGGYRENAGRNKVNNYETVVMRVPEPLKHEIKLLCETWKSKQHGNTK